MDSSDALHERVQAFNVLHIDRGHDIYFRVEQVEDVLITLGMFAALNIGVGQFVNQNNRRFSRQDGFDIHFGKERAFVLNRLSRNDVELGNQVSDAFAPMGFNHTDDDVLTAAVPADTLAQHAVGLANTRSVAKKQFEYSLLLLGRDFFQPLFWTLLHEFIVI
jgi:hypothetical protein